MSRYVALVLAAAALACERRPPPLPPVDLAAYSDSMTQFHARRENGIYGGEGWATLLGLWWLKPGETRIGTTAEDQLVLRTEHAPKTVGSLFVYGAAARFVPARGVYATADSVPGEVADLSLRSDLEEHETRLRVGSLLFQYVVRNGQPGLRVKDTLHPVRFTGKHLLWFPVDTAFRVQAQFIPRPTPDSMNIISVLGMETRMSWPGALRFDWRGREYELQVIREPEDHSRNMFVMFRDSTNGRETYPAMRYVYVSPPDSLGRTVIDFNKAYNPPCGFTNFATCPLPPRGNELPFRVTAGELKPAGHP